jgi:hypothetical protein
MTRPNLRAIPKRKAPSLSEVKRALRLFASDYASKETRRRNALAWLRSVSMLGNNWILAGRKEVSWGAKERKAS